MSDKPREFWVNEEHKICCRKGEGASTAEGPIPLIHAIEYSAYEKLRREMETNALNHVDTLMTSESRRREVAKLRDQLAVAVECLQTINGPCNWSIQHDEFDEPSLCAYAVQESIDEALAKLKGTKE